MALPQAQTEEVSIIFWFGSSRSQFTMLTVGFIIGRGGFQQSFGPPAQVLGIIPPLYNFARPLIADVYRNGNFYARLRGRDGLRVG